VGSFYGRNPKRPDQICVLMLYFIFSKTSQYITKRNLTKAGSSSLQPNSS